jgi:esterase FrsA
VFTFPVDTSELLAERTRQMVDGWGVPAPVVADVRGRVREMWSEDQTGWTPVWAEHAERAEREDKWLLAALCWGGARFPCLATSAKQDAYERQGVAYQRAIASFPTDFERVELEAAMNGATTSVPVHVFRRRWRPGQSLLVLCSGVDTWKVELHQSAVRIAQATGLTVAALDMPGTGESRVALTPGADAILADAGRQLAERYGARRTGFFGFSFGGHWAAKLALTRRVDAAIDLGGPVGAGEHPIDAAALPYGMPGILGHAFGFDEDLGGERLTAYLDSFSLARQGLLDGRAAAPLLVVNGDHDQFLPLADTTVFASCPTATVWVVRDATHVAAERLSRVIPAALGWLATRLHDDSVRYRILEGALRLPLRPHLARQAEAPMSSAA